ncbi:PEP-CTERM sorting domain-containing protein [Reinekea sp. G2M2-21]|uniref:PEP-CTERM sorting domain-containing protein n=1 Tax=Reinekea sp. G2M2-21 TaxID=2788942 RepID=UPI0018ABBA63|nr:PEP-CTERM sorting domain-containing protein [Reinekea sp. G2M2-21]
MKLMKKIATLAVTVVFASAAFSNPIVDTISVDEYVGHWQSLDYTHDINDDGFVLGSAVSGTLSISVSDDRDSWWNSFEAVLFTIEDFDFDTGSFSFGTSFYNDLEVEALGALNGNGLLDVTITSLWGDFYVGESVLTVVTNVREPATLALFGFGIAALFAARRRKPQPTLAV